MSFTNNKKSKRDLCRHCRTLNLMLTLVDIEDLSIRYDLNIGPYILVFKQNRQVYTVENFSYVSIQ